MQHDLNLKLLYSEPFVSDQCLVLLAIGSDKGVVISRISSHDKNATKRHSSYYSLYVVTRLALWLSILIIGSSKLASRIFQQSSLAMLNVDQ